VLVDLANRGDAAADEPVSDLLEGRPLQFIAGASGHGEVRVRRDVDQPLGP
jgi:hypothetical protein